MNVVVISSTFPPRRPAAFCGVGDYTARLCAALVAQGVAVDVLTDVGFAGPAEPQPGLRVHALLPGWRASALPAIARFLRRREGAVVNLQYQPDILGRRWSPFNGLLAALAGRTPRALVTTLHTVANPAPWSPTRLTARALARASRRLVVTNERHLDEVAALGRAAAAKTRLIPVGSNILPPAERLAQRAAVRRDVRRALGVPAEALLLAHFGRIYPGKGLETLLDALRGSDARLLIIGHVPPGMAGYQAQLATQAAALGVADRVYWTGALDEAAVSDALLATDIFAVPYADGLSSRRGSAMSGLAHGLPLVSTRGAATADFFVNDENVLLLPPGDAAALRAAVAALGADPARRAALGAAGRRLAETFAWPAIARQMITLFLEAQRP